MSELRRPVPVILNGPHGAPVTYYTGVRHPIFVSTGIGITPFVSALTSLMRRWAAYTGAAGAGAPAADEDPDGAAAAYDLERTRLHRFPDTVDMFWCVRNHPDLSWFASTWRELDRINGTRRRHGMPPLARLHLFVTGGMDTSQAALQRKVKDRGGLLGAFLLSIALRHHHKERGFCLLSDSNALTRFGRPNWRQELREVVDSEGENEAEGGVISAKRMCAFVCGGELLCEAIADGCRRLGLPLRRENFA